MPNEIGPLSSPSARTRVLLIEDSVADRLLIEGYLAGMSFPIELSVAENLNDGRNFLYSQEFDCILLDQFLPDGGGLSFLQELNSDKVDHAIVVLSSSDNSDFQEQLLASGASDYLEKSSLNASNLERVISYSQARQIFVRKIYEKEIENKALMAALRDTNAHLDELVEIRTSQFKIAQQLAKDKARQAEQASKVKSEFLATMSHEIRTPLNGVIGMLELLNMTELDDEQTEFVNTGKMSAQLLLSLINDILDISRIEAGRFELADSGFDLRDIIEQIGLILRPKAEGKNLNFSIQISPLLYTHVMGDAVRLRQVLVNLGDNAIKYTDHGDVLIRVERLMAAPAGKESGDKQVWVRFSVQDTGIGIAEESLSKIFEPFTQVDSSFARRHGGTGLGLAIVHRLVDIMGGVISVESIFNKGSIFSCDLPFYKCMLQQSMEDALSVDLSGKNILVVDPDHHNSENLRMWLEKWGAAVQIVSCGSDALKELEKSNEEDNFFDVIFVSDELPDMRGKTLRQTISRNINKAQIIRVIINTHGNADEFQNGSIDTPVVVEELALALLYLVGLEEITLPPSLEGVNDKDDENLSVEKSIQNYHVLLVEDNETNQMVAIHILEKIGFGYVDCVDNGEQALEILKKQPFDLVLMDCQLPAMDGYEVTQLIRQWEVENHKVAVPIIAMTANAMAGDRERCLNAGMNEYIAKPVVFESLKKKVLGFVNLDKKDKCL